MKKLFKRISILFALALLLGAFGLGAAPAFQAAQLQPALAGLAAESPDQTVRVMVAARGERAELVGLVESLGGAVVKDLHIINALAAEMPAGAAASLAQHAGVAWLSLDAPVVSSGKPGGGGGGNGGGGGGGGSGSLPPSTYLDTLGVRDVWAMGYNGAGIGVAVIDSGISVDRDFSTEPGKPFTRVVKAVNFANSTTTSDEYGHGTHVAGIIGGHGGASGGLYSGIASGVNLISLKISDDYGMAYESDTVEALQWVLDNKAQYNIRVVNLSIQSASEVSYHNSPLAAATEILWFNGVVVVAATGNWSGGNVYPLNAPPANDPFIITVGATDEKGTARVNDDNYMSSSVFGSTQDGHFKPEIWAPGKDIISVLAHSSDWDNLYPDREIMNEYFRISGTSMATPMVSGAVALLLQAEPGLTPDQVKYRVMEATNWVSGMPYLSVKKMLTTSTTASANTGITASQLLWTGNDPINWNSVNWNSVNWNSVNWNSVNWNSVNWNSVNWNALDCNE